MFGVLPLECNFGTWIRWKEHCRAICSSPSCVRTGCTVFEWVRGASVKWGSCCAGDGCSTVLENNNKTGPKLPCLLLIAHLLWKWSLCAFAVEDWNYFNKFSVILKLLISGNDMGRERQLRCSSGHCFLHVWSPSNDLNAVSFVLRHRWTKMS